LAFRAIRSPAQRLAEADDGFHDRPLALEDGLEHLGVHLGALLFALLVELLGAAE
jgi:hypothetical protein